MQVSFTSQSHILARSNDQKVLSKLLWACRINKEQGITLDNVCLLLYQEKIKSQELRQTKMILKKMRLIKKAIF